jgi:hypothetical protein
MPDRVPTRVRTFISEQDERRGDGQGGEQDRAGTRRRQTLEPRHVPGGVELGDVGGDDQIDCSEEEDDQQRALGCRAVDANLFARDWIGAAGPAPGPIPPVAVVGNLPHEKLQHADLDGHDQQAHEREGEVSVCRITNPFRRDVVASPLGVGEA